MIIRSAFDLKFIYLGNVLLIFWFNTFISDGVWLCQNSCWRFSYRVGRKYRWVDSQSCRLLGRILRDWICRSSWFNSFFIICKPITPTKLNQKWTTYVIKTGLFSTCRVYYLNTIPQLNSILGLNMDFQWNKSTVSNYSLQNGVYKICHY